MTMWEEEPSEEELNAFLDGEMDEARARDMAARIAAAPSVAKRVAQLRRDKERLAEVYGGLIDQPLPQALLDRVAAASAPQPSRWPLGIAAALIATVALAAGLWLAFGHFAGGPADRLVADALAARGGTLRAESEIPATALASPQARDRLVADEIGVAVKVPDLRKAGYALAAITVYPDGPQRHRLQLQYRNVGGRIFTVYLAGRSRPEGFELIGRGSLRICIWRTDELSAVMVGEMSTNEMLRVASLTYADLNF